MCRACVEHAAERPMQQQQAFEPVLAPAWLILPVATPHIPTLSSVPCSSTGADPPTIKPAPTLPRSTALSNVLPQLSMLLPTQWPPSTLAPPYVRGRCFLPPPLHQPRLHRSTASPCPPECLAAGLFIHFIHTLTCSFSTSLTASLAFHSRTSQSHLVRFFRTNQAADEGTVPQSPSSPSFRLCDCIRHMSPSLQHPCPPCCGHLIIPLPG